MESNTASRQDNVGAKPKSLDYNEIKRRMEELERDPGFLYKLEKLRIENSLTAEDLSILIIDLPDRLPDGLYT